MFDPEAVLIESYPNTFTLFVVSMEGPFFIHKVMHAAIIMHMSLCSQMQQDLAWRSVSKMCFRNC